MDRQGLKEHLKTLARIIFVAEDNIMPKLKEITESDKDVMEKADLYLEAIAEEIISKLSDEEIESYN